MLIFKTDESTNKDLFICLLFSIIITKNASLNDDSNRRKNVVNSFLDF